MTSPLPQLYFDLGSPYAYLAVERAGSVLGGAVELEPVLLGAIFQWRGSGSWARTDQRLGRIADLEQRAQRYGLPPFAWPAGWPGDGLAAMRAVTWAKQQQRADEFARAVFRRQFVDGADIADIDVLADCASEAGLEPSSLPVAIRAQAVKDELRQTTQRAWDVGVRGVPTLRVGANVFYGDDRLEEAALR